MVNEHMTICIFRVTTPSSRTVRRTVQLGKTSVAYAFVGSPEPELRAFMLARFVNQMRCGDL